MDTKKKEKEKNLGGKSLQSCLMCWCLIYCNDLPGSLRFIRSSIHALLSAGQNNSEAMQPSALK